MLGLTLYAALATADADVRASPLYQYHCELSAFPPAAVLLADWNAAKAYRDWLQVQALTDGRIGGPIERAYQQQQLVCAAYWRLDNARDWLAPAASQSDFALRCVWLNALSLRHLIGDEAYFFGRLPPPVPGWGQ